MKLWQCLKKVLMRNLIDTHIVIWLAKEPSKLSDDKIIEYQGLKFLSNN